MPDVNMSVFEEVQRNQLVTKVNIQTQVALDDYQVQLSDITNPTQSQDNVVIDRFGEFLPHWNESLDFDTWVKVNMEVAGKQILMLRGNDGLSSKSSGSDTFIQYHGSASAQFFNTEIVIPSEHIYEAKAKVTNDTHNIRWGITNREYVAPVDSMQFRSNSANASRYIISYDESNVSFQSEAQDFSVAGGWHQLKYIKTLSSLIGIVEGNPIGTSVTTNFPNENMGLMMYVEFGTAEQEYSFIRKYTATEPTWAVDGEQNIAVALKSLGRAG